MALTSISLGNFYTTNDGKTVLGDVAGAGFDTQALVNSLTASSTAKATQDQTQITKNNMKTVALTQLQTLLTTFKSASAALSNPPGISNVNNNVFAFTTANIGNGGSSYVSVTSSPGADSQTYNISNIQSVASKATQSSGVFNLTSANSDATIGSGTVFNPGTITFSNASTVTINSGDSLNTIAANFNAVSTKTGIGATVIQIDSTHYKLSFAATATGTNGNFDLSSAGTVTSGSAVLAGIGLNSLAAGPAVAGTNAVFDLNGTTITRQSNNVSDAINNVTFNILQKTPDNTTVYPATVGHDLTSVATAMGNFISAYNALQTFGAQQTQLNPNGTFSSTAVLASDPTFQSVINSVDQTVESQVTGILGSNPTGLTQIGITFTNQAATSTTPAVANLLTANAVTLNTALNSNFSGVQNVFGLNSTSTDANFALYSHTQPIGVTDFAVTIDPGANVFTATYTQNGHSVTSNLTPTATSGFSSGYTLTGARGSALAGATFLYVSSNASTFNVHVSQGIADKSNILATTTLTPTTGSLAVSLAGLQSSNTQLNTDITNVKAQGAVYQKALIAKFSALEQAISSSNSLLQSLSANENAALVNAGG